MSEPYLIAGLGNPGAEYARTRHNAGFLALEELAREWQASGWKEETRFNSMVARANRSGRPAVLVRPLTYMNLSGAAIGAVIRFFRIPLTQVLVVVDDADLPLGTLRLRTDGSAGGHHGLESVESHLGTRAYARQRIGIGRLEPGVREITGHVLGRFSAAETDIFRKVLPRAVAQITCWLEEGIGKAMTRYNGPLTSSESREETK